jgi:hypothetical protein
MADYSAMKSYLEKNNLQYFFNFSSNSEKPINTGGLSATFPQTRQQKIFLTALRA